MSCARRLAAIHGYAELTRQDSSVLAGDHRVLAGPHRSRSAADEFAGFRSVCCWPGSTKARTWPPPTCDLADVVVDAVNDAAVSAPTHRWVTSVPDGPVWVRRRPVPGCTSCWPTCCRMRGCTPPAGTTVTTSIATGRADDGAAYVELTVTDDGPGIPSELLPHLFERFVRADKSRSRQAGNFGLGLSIAASIAEAHNGSIEAELGWWPHDIPGAPTGGRAAPGDCPRHGRFQLANTFDGMCANGAIMTLWRVRPTAP